MEILHLEDLSFCYNGAEKTAIEHISLSVNRGEFVVVCGESGCGKTTLLKLLKRELAPAGTQTGKIFYNGVLQQELDEKTSACEIGFVLQNPDSQIVTDKVWHELAFGLENMGLATNVIRRRVGEMASYFGIQGWFRKNTNELSGGQKQLLNLAAVMVMQPKVLILDEPTGQLDPIAAADFIATLQKLNRELGLTVILVEHRLEEVFSVADKVLFMENGGVLLYDCPKKIGARLSQICKTHPMLQGLPSAVRIFQALNLSGECPLTVKEGRDFLEKHFLPENGARFLPKAGQSGGGSEEPAVELKNVWFRYEKDLPDVLRGTSLQVRCGEVYCVLGGNGTGKTTMLNVISGLNKAYRGKVLINGKPIRQYKGNSLYRGTLAFLPQNPQTVFVKDTVEGDLTELLQALEVPKNKRQEKVAAVAEKMGVQHLLKRHPFDLSGGEQQKCAIAKMLLLEPKILLLDEPTKGLDAYSKQALKKVLSGLKKSGLTILMVTHDVEFAAENADRCALFFDGENLSADVPERFFAQNNFYTTAANRMARGLWQYAVTCEQVVACAKKSGGNLA